MNVQYFRFYFILTTLYPNVLISSQCLSRYIMPPIDGFSCHSTFFKNLSDISLELCVANCVRDESCWTLSYNHPGNYCILADEACVSAEEIPNFVMFLLRSNETQPCVQWIPFSRTYGVENGYPERAITGKSSSRQRGAVARAFTGQNLLAGFQQLMPIRPIYLILIKPQ